TEGRFLEDGREVDPASEEWLKALLEACAFTNRATIAQDGEGVLGDPTDAALLIVARKGGV
ncbi:MAG: hypothetical protein GWN85_22305, partial [Gemmatimonadetes bacterium]|nr:hypothetical protein [Gemmatimonadota bacterium]